jgi:hypothetical protein
MIRPIGVRSIGAALCAAIAVVFAAHVAQAGDGEIVPDASNPGRFVINATTFVDLPRTAEELAAIQEQFQGASRLMCDYTQGFFRLGTIGFENHPARKRGADIWWFRRADRATAPGTFGRLPDSNGDGLPDNDACTLLPPIKVAVAAAGGRFNIYGTQAAEVIAHELGHLVFGMGDHYGDSRGLDDGHVRSTGFNGVHLLLDPASGLSFFRSPAFGDVLKDQPLLTDVPTAPLGPDVYRWDTSDPTQVWWRVNNSMMQEAMGQVCVDILGRSTRQANPLLWPDYGCLSIEDANNDLISDDCGPRCIGGTNPDAPCISDLDCPGSGGRCNGGSAPQCVGGIHPGAPCAVDSQCGAGGFCRGGAAHLACIAGPTLGRPCTQASDCGAGGVCSPVGAPFCLVGEIGMNSELSAVLNHERSRFNMSFGISSPPGGPPPGVPTGHPQPANHLVLQGFLYPSSDALVSAGAAAPGQPAPFSGGDQPCFSPGDDFASDPLGGCDDTDLMNGPDLCNPAIVAGDPEFELQCTIASRQGSAACPGQALATSPDFGIARDAQCDGCVLGNTTQCTAMFPIGGGADQCGNGTLDSVFAAGGAVERFEQCDTGMGGVIDPTQPVIDPATGQPLRCRDLFSPWRVDAGENRADTEPDPPLSGGVVRCQANCFFDLSECSHAYLREGFVDADLDGTITLREAADQSTAWTFAEAFDSGGRVHEPANGSPDGLNLATMGPSNHGVFAFFRRMLRYRAPLPGTGVSWPTFNDYTNHLYREVWQLVVALDAGELCPGSAGCPEPNPFSGRLHEVRRLELEFEMDYPNRTSQLVSVNGVTCGGAGADCLGADDTQWPVVFLGFSPNPPVADPYVGAAGACHLDSGCGTAQPPTGVFQRRECTNHSGCVPTATPGVTLRLDLRSLIAATVEGPLDHGLSANVFAPLRRARDIFNYRSFAGQVNAYARSGLQELACTAVGSCGPMSGSGEVYEIPQYGTLRYRYGLEMPACASNPASTCCYRCDDPASVNKPECLTQHVNTDGIPDVDECRYFDELAKVQDYYTYNEVTKTYESALSTILSLQRQYFGGPAIRGYDAVTAQAPAIANPDAAIDSDWQALQKVMCSQYGVEIPVIPQDGPEIDHDAEALCNTQVVFANPEKAGGLDVFNEDTQVLFVLDQSGSMNASQPVPAPGFTSSRLDYVKNAANAFVQDMLASAALDPQSEHAPKVGVVWYSDFPMTKFPDTNSVDCGGSGRAACLGPAADESNVCAVLGSNQSCVTDADCNDGDEECFLLGATGQCGQNARCADKLRYVSYDGLGADETSDDILMTVLQPGLVPDPADPSQPRRQPEIPTAGVDEDNPNNTCETCSDGGFTGSGAALLLASKLFDPRPRVDAMGVSHKPTQILVFLSDGMHNRPIGGHCLGAQFCSEVQNSQCVQGTCGGNPCDVDDAAPDARCQELFEHDDCELGDLPECWPTSIADQTFQAAVDQLSADADGDGQPDVLVYSVPLANEANRLSAAIASGQTLGEVFNATRPQGEDTIAQFSQAQAAAAGQQLARSHLSLSPTVVMDFSDFLLEQQIHAIEVEAGAPSLTVRISDADAGDEYFLVDEHLDPDAAPPAFEADQIALVSPDMTPYFFVADQTDPAVAFDRQLLTAALHISAPVGGTWHVMRTRLLVSEDPNPIQPIYVTAQTGSVEPACYAFTSTKVTDGSAPVTVTAQAFYERPIIEGVTYRAQLLRADQVLVDLPFVRDPASGRHQATIDPAQLVGRGTYEVNVECDVGEGAVVDPGERTHGPAPETPVQPVPFKREVTLGFFNDAAGLVSIPGLSGNNQPQTFLDRVAESTCDDALAFAALIFPTPPLSATCLVPPSTAPVGRFVGDADGDGIPNGEEGPANQDTDLDGNPDAFDSDANGNEVPDGRDPRFCDDDPDPPDITAASVSVDLCVDGDVEVALTVTATDDSCADSSVLNSLSGLLVSVNGTMLTDPVELDPLAPTVRVPVGTSLVEWTATDVNGNTSVQPQTITVTRKEDTSCCAPGQIIVQGNNFANSLVFLNGQPYCIFGKGGGDTIRTGTGADYLAGGTSNDLIKSSGASNVLVGGTGNDWLEMPLGSGSVFGGPGREVVEDTHGGVIYGNADDDFIETDFATHTIIPGPGEDSVYGGTGDDTVIIYDVCELEWFEVLDGGFGNDTLITPVSTTQLFFMGVSVSHFENIIVTDDNRHLSECF